MSLEDLQLWLRSIGIREDLDAITRLTVRAEFDNLNSDDPAIADVIIRWPQLLLAGSILARSDQRSDLDAALRIATAAVTLDTDRVVKDAGAVLLGKLSNFRAISLATNRELLATHLMERLGVALRLETQRREIEHSILVESSGSWIQASDFQRRFWSRANEGGWLSASAPTASGKTYLVLQWLIDQVAAGKAKTVIYLAPTRALVAEVESKLEFYLRQNRTIEVSSLPLADKYQAALAGDKPLILVFTQERLHLLANVLANNIVVDLLIVDEAQKIGDNQRGVILQDAVERIVRVSPRAGVVFLSPATENPEVLLADAPDGVKSAAIDSDASTVLQNLILASQVPGKSRLWRLDLVQESSLLPIGVLKLASAPISPKKKLAFIAAALGQRGGTLVYVNGAAESEDVADLIGQLLPTLGDVDTELGDLADLARKGVHREYRLAQVLQRGVAFHYGNMPSLLRLEIERLFRTGKIRCLVCTSTLIEGVNMSCRTIVVRGPRKGVGHPMEPHDFWNLAGRAGRWGDEFQGNIVCIDPEDRDAWPNGVPRRARYPIKRESDAALEKADGLAAYLTARNTPELPVPESRNEFEQVGAYFLANFLRTGSVANPLLSRRHAPTAIAKVEEVLEAVSSRIQVGIDLVTRHPGVSAIGMQRLLDFFRAYEGDVGNLTLAEVASSDSYDRLITIMLRINEYMFPAFLPESRIRLYALIVVKWLKGYSLARIIQYRIEWHDEARKSFSMPGLIRDTMELVEQIARFRAPKYFSAYVDVLDLYLRQIGRTDLIVEDLDIGTQLEFGVSSKTLLSLMQLGLSRMSAVALNEKISRDDLTKDDCLLWIAGRLEQLESMGIAVIMIREIRERFSEFGNSRNPT